MQRPIRDRIHFGLGQRHHRVCETDPIMTALDHSDKPEHLLGPYEGGAESGSSGRSVAVTDLQTLIRILADLPCRHSWIDPRPEAAPADPPPNIAPGQVSQPFQRVDWLKAGQALQMEHE